MTPDSKQIMAALHACKPRLQQEMGITRLRVFGSVARGEATAESDVDLIADFATMPGLIFFSMDKKIADMIGRKVDLTTEGGLHKRLKSHILSEAQDVW
ncbi:MAG: nucleotidyltransferase [Alphaproteobacteria bacterium CG_4_9_14_3_um_filter_47_13]|nr:MAG: nucleotidyltransferase [Alphaproteobacteria bacterium CG_4_9_14_3_um_filter_47_13]